MKKTLALAFAIVFVATPVLAFHDGGVAHCNGCHTMHNSQDGQLVDPDAPNGNPYLLTDGSPSDVCLNCHASRLGAVFAGTVDAPGPQYPGGNFIFLLEDNVNDGHSGASNPISGDAAGHNLLAPGRGLAPDGTLGTSPGGGFPSAVLGCSSCHDPHGTDAFRLLHTAGSVVQGGVATFLNAAPNAIGNGFSEETNIGHTAYLGGMSAWCGNCHGLFHDEANGRLEHPSGSSMTGFTINTYNLYNGTDDLLGGSPATAYLAAVPFEDPANTTTSTAGPTTNSQVSCISCHRAHASSAADAGRWDFDVTFLFEDGDESGSYEIPNPYLATSGNNQRSLCNKCHKKDEFDAPHM